ncbi:hypothetical protein [uncultured Mobiluncus sp.]|uniref:hypothetical protein n=1 Tax=uncultured Mobiluncus sp. TaxID=293425 RepID=UPI00288A3FEE|nr:hypothetical protein [uncultured Mobiluncus sp.]
MTVKVPGDVAAWMLDTEDKQAEWDGLEKRGKEIVLARAVELHLEDGANEPVEIFGMVTMGA